MNFTNALEELGINLHGKRGGLLKTQCPKCGNAKHKFDLSVNIDEGLYKCHRASCDFTGYIKIQKPVELKKDFILPELKNVTALSNSVVEWFRARGISSRTLMSMKITDGKEFMPQAKKQQHTIQFNYFRNGKLLNVKYRDGAKNFKLVAGAELLLYNEDALDKESVIITEGEIDALSFYEIGLENVVSVPNGASEGKMNLDFIAWDKLEKIKRVYLATDNDAPGIALRNELARRIGAAKCLLIDFKDCKDANEYLVKHGSIEFGELINEAKPMPIAGIITVKDISQDVDDYYNKQDERGSLLGLAQLDELVSFETGQKTIITGIPNHGKSEMLDQIICLLNVRHDWKFGIYSPENYPLAIHVAKLSEKVIGKRFKGYNRMSEDEKNTAKEYLNENFYFIHPEDENYTLDNILHKARQLVMRYGIKGLVIDPYNRLEHHISHGESETNFISKQLDKMDTFCKMCDVHLFLVAHPVKINKDKSGEYEIPNLYSISGSSNFFNKADIGMCVYRNFTDNVTEVYVQKVRFKYIGKQGMVRFSWDESNGRYTELGNSFDKDNYLKVPKVPEHVQVSMERMLGEKSNVPF